jgi:hypothetical protein
MWPFRKKKEQEDKLPDAYKKGIEECLVGMVNMYPTTCSQVIMAYRYLLENPRGTIVNSSGLFSEKVKVFILTPSTSGELLGVPFEAKEGTITIAFSLDGKTTAAIWLGVQNEDTLKRAVANFLQIPCEMISRFQIKYLSNPLKVDTTSFHSEKLERILSDLIKEDSKLVDRLLGYPDTEVQEIALKNMKTSL